MDITGTKSLQGTERLFLALAGVAIVASGILTYSSGAAVRTGVEQADVTCDVMDMASSLFSARKDAETRKPGFPLRGEDRCLELVWVCL